ncbi:MAG TPA: microviridin/marinostatin family tricyclic proteinase inhibitor [Pyrinomonadaceae bacterium]
MKGRKKKDADAPATTPFFARYLEDQHGGTEAQAAASHMTLKYPSDRDEIDDYLHAPAEAAAAKPGPSGMTLKYPSDRDEIDNYRSL